MSSLQELKGKVRAGGEGGGGGGREGVGREKNKSESTLATICTGEVI